MEENAKSRIGNQPSIVTDNAAEDGLGVKKCLAGGSACSTEQARGVGHTERMPRMAGLGPYSKSRDLFLRLRLRARAALTRCFSPGFR